MTDATPGGNPIITLLLILLLVAGCSLLPVRSEGGPVEVPVPVEVTTEPTSAP